MLPNYVLGISAGWDVLISQYLEFLVKKDKPKIIHKEV